MLEGGSLIHRLQWQRGSAFGAIADAYSEFSLQNYGKATVVFDGYQDSPSIKDCTHARRRTRISPNVKVVSEIIFDGYNKQALIKLFSVSLMKRGCNVIQSHGDADCQLVQTTINKSDTRTTTLMGEDTDLLTYSLTSSSKAKQRKVCTSTQT